MPLELVSSIKRREGQVILGDACLDIGVGGHLEGCGVIKEACFSGHPRLSGLYI